VIAVPLPKVAIVGRPNVGKSSLFNWLAGRRIAIVDPTAGVTRDRLGTVVEAGGRVFEVVDTGGMGIEDVDQLTEDVERQIEIALKEASAVLFLVDARDGVVPLDQLVASRLRQTGKPVALVVTKCDTPDLDVLAHEFHRLGFGEPLCVSAHQLRHKEELLQAVVERLPPPAEGEAAPPEDEMKLAIVGRRNVGKSTLINAFAEQERVIVSEVAGTTRDSVDVRFERDGKSFLAIDTAGLRRRGSIANSIDFYSLARAERSIRRADVVLQLFDPRDTISKVDKQLADYILENHKPAVFVVNKWDLAKNEIPTGSWVEYLQKTFPALAFVPMAFITAKSGKNVQALLNLAQSLYKQAGARVSTADLNRVVSDATERQSPPVRRQRTPRIYFATQAAVRPPTIVLMTNGVELLEEPYLRYLLHTFRQKLPFREVPIKLVVRDKERDGGGKGREGEAAAVEPVAAPRSHRRKKTPAGEPEVWKDV
jgi:GTP-binding protein